MDEIQSSPSTEPAASQAGSNDGKTLPVVNFQFKLDVQKGIIQDAAVYGDFFSTLDASAICKALIGCPYDRSAVLDALRSNGIDGAVYCISAEEMASVIAD